MSAPLDPAALAELEAELARLAAEAADERERRDGSLREILTGLSDGTADDEHDPEGTPLSAEWSRMAGVRAESLRQVAAVAAARERLRTGRYGLCAACDRPIGEARLRARPTAELCIDCARRVEQHRR